LFPGRNVTLALAIVMPTPSMIALATPARKTECFAFMTTPWFLLS
jgi:hypothetical protein